MGENGEGNCEDPRRCLRKERSRPGPSAGRRPSPPRGSRTHDEYAKGMSRRPRQCAVGNPHVSWFIFRRSGQWWEQNPTACARTRCAQTCTVADRRCEKRLLKKPTTKDNVDHLVDNLLTMGRKRGTVCVRDLPHEAWIAQRPRTGRGAKGTTDFTDAYPTCGCK